jgi:hypothetical protein
MLNGNTLSAAIVAFGHSRHLRMAMFNGSQSRNSTNRRNILAKTLLAS